MRQWCLIFIFAWTGAFSSYGQGTSTVPAPPLSTFDEVTQQLDQGGDLFLFLNATTARQRMREWAQEYVDLITGMMGITPEEEEFQGKMDELGGLINATGWGQLSAIGMSNLKLANNYYRARLVLHREVPARQASTLFWDMTDDKPCSHYKHYPQQTVGLYNTRLNLSAGIAWFKSILEWEPLPGFSADEQLEKLKASRDDLLSFGNECALGILDSPTFSLNARTDETAYRLVLPEFLATLEVKDPKSFRWLLKTLQGGASARVLNHTFPLVRLTFEHSNYSYTCYLGYHLNTVLASSNPQHIKTFAAHHVLNRPGGIEQRTDWKRAFPHKEPAQQLTFRSAALKPLVEKCIAASPQIPTGERHIWRHYMGFKMREGWFAAKTYKRPGGWFVEGHGSHVMVTPLLGHFATNLGLNLTSGLVAAGVLHPQEALPLPVDHQPPPTVRALPAPVASHLNAQDLEKMGMAVIQYRKRNRAMPSSKGLTGLRQIARYNNMDNRLVSPDDNSPNYYYFGTGFSSANQPASKIPILLERPNVVADSIGVVFLGGGTKRVRGTFKNGREVIDQLNKEGLISPKELNLLRVKVDYISFE